MNTNLARKFWIMWGILGATAVAAGLCGKPFYVVESVAVLAAICGYIGFILS